MRRTGTDSGTVAPVTSLAPTAIVVQVTPEVTSGDVVVKRLRRSSAFGLPTRPAFCAVPTIGAFTPTGGNLYVEIVVTGANFDPRSEIGLGTHRDVDALAEGILARPERGGHRLAHDGHRRRPLAVRRLEPPPAQQPDPHHVEVVR